MFSQAVPRHLVSTFITAGTAPRGKQTLSIPGSDADPLYNWVKLC
jgi:hypothetical protein